MIDWADIRRYCDAIAREFKPQRIVVFGSYAYGNPTDDSDVDVMVVMPFSRKRRVRPSLEIRRRIAAGFPVDILVRTPEEIVRRLRWGDSFILEVMTQGRVMYEAGHA
ncbi:MAG: nucleotidyltransferase domain-containing protein [Verrucomicrobia bacterium]|nr:nucleotidyltransferase domain-containing protein [Verrucomicrobiota bacterium]